MNILTFDIEEWGLAKMRGIGTSEKYAEFDGYLNDILDLLDKREVKATFFCTGMMASDFPNVVKLIYSRGHEIGCHSYQHIWMNRMTEAEAREDTHKAIDALEQCIGEKIFSYRAPAFSIGSDNRWMFDILLESGITQDASIFPIGRDFGGFKGFSSNKPCLIEYNGCYIKEYPVSTTILFNKEFAYSGGGYFRLFPLWFVKNRIKKADYVMAYFHIGDLIPEKRALTSKKEYEAYYHESGTLVNRYKRNIKTNLGKANAYSRMLSLVNQTNFIGLKEAERIIDWDTAPIVVI